MVSDQTRLPQEIKEVDSKRVWNHNGRGFGVPLNSHVQRDDVLAEFSRGYNFRNGANEFFTGSRGNLLDIANGFFQSTV